MSTNFLKFISSFFIFIFILTLFITCFSPQIISNSSLASLNGTFIWPLPGYNYISSYFGTRTSPTIGASNYHSGIDIPAPAGTSILSICDGIVSFASWGARRWLYNSCSKW